MWEILARMGVILRSDINNEICIEITTYLKEMIYGLKSADELLEMLYKKRYLPEMKYEGWYVGTPVPNEETAFVVQTVNVMYTALKNGNTELAYDIADLWQALPEKRFLSDKGSIDIFNSVYIENVNRKWKEQLIPKLLLIQ